jgi:dCMP deaminase
MRSVLSKDEYFYGFAEHAALRSKDVNTNIGAVIVGPGDEIRSTGYNSFPRGIDDSRLERQERPEKYFWFEHAERNAIFCAARHGAALDGCRMYLNCFVPCTDCARAIIQVGIKEVILGKHDQSNQVKWLEAAKRSLQMFQEAGVCLRYPGEPAFSITDMILQINKKLKAIG